MVAAAAVAPHDDLAAFAVRAAEPHQDVLEPARALLLPDSAGDTGGASDRTGHFLNTPPCYLRFCRKAS